MTPEGQRARDILDWVNDDIPGRLEDGREQVRELGAPLLDADPLGQPLREVGDVARIMAKLTTETPPPGQDATPGISSQLSSTISGQAVIELRGWSGWRTELRDSHGRWTRGGLSTPSVQGKIGGIERSRAVALKRAGQARRPAQLSPETKKVLHPVMVLAPEKTPDVPSIDHRMVIAHAKNAASQVQKARRNGSLSAGQAEEITKAIDSLSKSALAADREIHDLQEREKARDDRLATLEQALRELAARQEVAHKNEQLKDRVIKIKDKYDQQVAEAHEENEHKASILTTIGASMANFAITVGSFFVLPGSTPVSQHEWMIAVVPIATAVAQAIAQPIYEARRNKKAKERLAAQQRQARESNVQQLATPGDGRRTGAVRMLAYVFRQAGLTPAQAASLAAGLVDEQLAA